MEKYVIYAKYVMYKVSYVKYGQNIEEYHLFSRFDDQELTLGAC